MKKTIKFISSFFMVAFMVYFGIGFYIASSILQMDYTCELNQRSLTNT